MVGGGGVRTNFFAFGGGVLSKFLLDNSSFSASPPDNYCAVPKSLKVRRKLLRNMQGT